MSITYTTSRDFTQSDLQDLFLSVNWSSGHFPEKLFAAMKNYETVISAWDGGRLVGLAAAMDDGVMTAYVHYLLVRPEYQRRGIGRRLVELVKDRYRDYLRLMLLSYDAAVPFYESCGFKVGVGEVPMFITDTNL